MTPFEQALSALLNSHSKEKPSNTRDFILAEYLNACLDAYNQAVVREKAHSAGDPGG